jgi:hypothetical protein
VSVDDRRTGMQEDTERTGYFPEGEGPVSNEWISGTKAEVEECARLMRRMLERSERMSEDMRVIKRCVMGEEG